MGTKFLIILNSNFQNSTHLDGYKITYSLNSNLQNNTLQMHLKNIRKQHVIVNGFDFAVIILRIKETCPHLDDITCYIKLKFAK